VVELKNEAEEAQEAHAVDVERREEGALLVVVAADEVDLEPLVEEAGTEVDLIRGDGAADVADFPVAVTEDLLREDAVEATKLTVKCCHPFVYLYCSLSQGRSNTRQKGINVLHYDLTTVFSIGGAGVASSPAVDGGVARYPRFFQFVYHRMSAFRTGIASLRSVLAWMQSFRARLL